MAGRAAKQLLRKQLKLRLLALSDSEKARQSQIVTEQVRLWQHRGFFLCGIITCFEPFHFTALASDEL